MSEQMNLSELMSILNIKKEDHFKETSGEDLTQEVFIKFKVQGVVFLSELCFGDVYMDDEGDIIFHLGLNKG